LEWAREQSGESVEDVAERLNREPSEIKSWEDGSASPTYPQLETLAYRIYKRPLAIFFFPEPPAEETVRESFRTLPDAEIDDLIPDTRFKLRLGRSLQVSLRELNEGRNPSRSDLDQFRSIRPVPPEEAAARLRELLKVNVATQKRWKSTEDALWNWRAALESLGLFVFRNTFEQEDFWGFSLDDEEFPLIYLNSSSSKTRQIFTLFHEAAHLMVHTSGVTIEDDSFVSKLRGEAKRLELFCNHFAAVFLVPSSDLTQDLRGQPPDDDEVKRLANVYKVSPEMLLGRLLDLGRISASYFRAAAARFREEYARLPKPKPGGTYYTTLASYLSDRFTRIAFGRYYQGSISAEQLSDYLGIRARNLPSFEDVFLKKAAR
jgi:Zn-dependent peptidase ImmA (M78 family)